MASRFVLLFIVLTLAGCASGTRPPFLPSIAPQAAALRNDRNGELLVRLTIPRGARRPNYFSTATKAISVDVTGPTNVSKTAGLSVTAKGCTSSLVTTQCALTIPSLTSCPSTAPCYTASVETYDAFNAATQKVPPHAHELSAVSGFKFTVGSASAVIPLVLDGIPKDVALLPARDSALSGSQAQGFLFPKCKLKPQRVSVVGIDADGNYIVGLGAPKASLVSGDKKQLDVKKPKSSDPNSFELVPPKPPSYPFGGYAVHLTVKVQSSLSGSSPVSKHVSVTYTPDICGVLTEFPIPSSGAHPYGIAAGSDGALWFTEASTNKIGRITVEGTFTEFPIPTAASLPTGIAAGSDGNLWFVENNASQVGKITTSGGVTEYATLTASASPYTIAAGPDGNLWFPEDSANKIARITTAGLVTEYSVPTASSGPYGIAAGSDGNMWFSESQADKIGIITTAGTITELDVPTASSSPIGLAAGSNGDMWFTECTSDKIGHASSLLGITAEATLPETGSKPAFMTRGPAGEIWFTEILGNRVAQLGNGLSFTEYAVPTAGAYPFGIVLGPDGAMWFTEFLTSKIVRLR